MYVNLEPCAHEGERRTAPCVPPVIRSGIARLVFGMRDPFYGHGGGAEAVARAGIIVAGPVEEQLCRRVNAPFMTYAALGRSHFTLAVADHAIAESPTLGVLERLRSRVDAILLGADTATSRDPLPRATFVRGRHNPVQVVLDRRLRISPSMLHPGSRTLIVLTPDAPRAHVDALQAAGASILEVEAQGHDFRLDLLASGLSARGLLSVLVEGDLPMHRSFLAAGLCDRLLLLCARPVSEKIRAAALLDSFARTMTGSSSHFVCDRPPRRIGDRFLVSAVPVAQAAG